MRKFILFALLLVIFKAPAQTQPVVNDTANFPYWIQMMQDQNANFYDVQKAFNTYWKDRKVTRSSGWKVFKRWEYMMSTRVLPNGDRPAPDATLRAYEEFLSNTDNTASLSGNWNSIGPAYIPLPGPAGYEGLGRINTIAWHPTNANKIYIGAPSGGMWQTDDGGVTWITHTDSLATLGVSAILIDAGNPSLILIGTGDRDAGDAPGLGVYRSNDGGLHWTQSNTGMGTKTVGKIIQSGSTILAATNGGMYRSTDGGLNWTLSTAGNFKDVLFKPGDPNTVYAAGGSNFYRSTNNGQSFTLINNGLPGGQRAAIAVSPANSTYVYVLISGNDSGIQGVYRSTDSGLSFTTMMTSPNLLDWSCDGSGGGGQGWYDLAIAADPTNANIIYVGGVNVWKSTDGGTTWNINSHWYGGCGVPAVHADCHFLGYSPVNGKLYAGNDGGIYSTSNGGTTWTDHTVGMTIGQIYKLGQAQQVREHVITGFQDNGTYSFTPGGWVATGGGDGMECAVDFENDSYTYHTIYYGDIFRKINNASEIKIAGAGVGGINESGDWVTPFILHATDAKVMFVGYNNVWRTTNARQPGIPLWTKISDNLGGSNNSTMRAIENCTANSNILYISRNDGDFFRSDNCMDLTPSWMDLSNGIPGNSTVSSIETHPTDENIVYITAGQSVYKSTDKGSTWTNITGNLPAVTKSSIAYYKNDSEGLYLGTDAGVYFRNSTMSNWMSFNAGMPLNARVTEIDIYYDNDSISMDAVRASTYGRGLWGSDVYRNVPDVEFTASSTTLSANCTIDFFDLSGNVPTNWLWTFTGGTPATSTEKNPFAISYALPGTYEVKLKAWNEAGVDSLIKTAYITVTPAVAPLAEFSSDKNAVCDGDKVHFTDESVNCPVSWTWEFTPPTVTYTDGTSAASQNPVVIFDELGIYAVKMTATNSIGSNSVVKTDYIFNGGYSVPFAEDFENGFDKYHWTIVNADGSKTWDTISVTGTTSGTVSVWMNFFNYTIAYKRDQLISPAFNLSTLTSATLTFEHAYAKRGTLRDSLLVNISIDCGNSWTRILSLGPELMATHPDTLEGFFPQSADEWCGGSFGTTCNTVDLTPYVGMKDVKIMFESYNRRGNNLFLDNINVTGPVGIPSAKEKDAAFKVYPNPTTGIINIIMNKPGLHTNLSVISPNGQILMHDSPAFTGNTHQINLSNLSKGIYYLRITTDSETSTQKIIIY